MKKGNSKPYLALTISMLICVTLISAATEYQAIARGNDWENSEILGRNKEPAHCTLIPYPDISTALKGHRSDSPFYKSLNGNWKFNWVAKPSERPDNFYELD